MSDDPSDQLSENPALAHNLYENLRKNDCLDQNSVDQDKPFDDIPKHVSSILSDTQSVFENMVMNSNETFSQCQRMKRLNKIAGIDHKLSNLFQFSFLTVCYRTRYSYCYCPCGLQHEYFHYINSETGEIDMTVLQKIAQNITNGTCPHTENFPEDFLTITNANPINILAVVGSSTSVATPLDWILPDNTTAIFGVHPFVNAVLSNNYKMLDFLVDISPKIPRNLWLVHITYPIRSENSSDPYIWEITSLLEYCGKTGNSRMFRYVLKTIIPFLDFDYKEIDANTFKTVNHCSALGSHVPLIALYDMIFKYNLKDIMHIILWKGLSHLKAGFGLNFSNYVSLKKEREAKLFICAMLAIVYNKPRVLDYTITQSAKSATKIAKRGFLDICMVLQTQNCRRILLKHGIYDVTEHDIMSLSEKHEQIHFLFSYSNCGKELVAFIQQHPALIREIRQCIICGTYDDFTMIGEFEGLRDSKLVKMQIQTALGMFVDGVEFAQKAKRNFHFRELFELWLYLNPSNLLCFPEYSFANLCLKSERLEKLFGERHPCEMIEYIIDGQEHKDDDAWNYALPLVIECGYKFKPTILEMLLHDFPRPLTRPIQSGFNHGLEPMEKLYLKTCLERPRSLQLCCRDTLRRHFKTNRIHEYMSVVKYPKKLKDFVLLKTLLTTLKYNERNLIF